MAVQFQDAAAHTEEHLVHFYADDAELGRMVGAYLTRALRGDGAAIVIATEQHRHLFVSELESAGVATAECLCDGTLVLLDAAATVCEFFHDGAVDHDAFTQTIAPIIRNAAEDRKAVYAYGEMVALQWEAGDISAAIELERCWNELATRIPFTLLCAYRSESVAGEEHAEALHEVCHLHTAVTGLPDDDDPAELTRVSAQFPADAGAPGSARRFVAEVLQGYGHGAVFLEDARLVISELATNAVLHARSPFSVEISALEGRVRLGVRDASPATPVVRGTDDLVGSGRGLRIVGAVASSWGVELAQDGKTVWAELRT
jgi:anti-sigma regulatory factor (Ser/Thr protein kinase)